MNERIVELDVTMVVPGDNDRTVFDQVALEELAASIAEHGLAQPITVRPVNGRYEIVAGERRYRAVSQVLNWPTIKAIVRDLDDEQAAAIMLAENTGRQDLNPIDEGRAYRKRMDQFGWSAKDVAGKAGVSEAVVRSRLKLLKLVPEAQKLIADGHLAVGYGEAMHKLDNNRQRIALRYFQETERPNMREFRELCSRLLEEQAQDSLFDLGAFFQMVEEAGSVETAKGAYIPTTDKLPRPKRCRSVADTMEQYFIDLLAVGKEEAAMAVSMVYKELVLTKGTVPPPARFSPLLAYFSEERR